MCTACSRDDEATAGQIRAWFTGTNELPTRTGQTRSEVVVADPGREFAGVVGGRFVRWGFFLEPTGGGTTLTETWHSQHGHAAQSGLAVQGLVARGELAVLFGRVDPHRFAPNFTHEWNSIGIVVATAFAVMGLLIFLGLWN